MIVNIGLTDWFGASGLRVMVKQPDSRGMPGFFPAIFSIVTQFDVYLVGWYNWRTKFLRRTAATAMQTVGRTELGAGGPL